MRRRNILGIATVAALRFWAGSASAWSPSDLPNLVLWLDASDATTMTIDGSGVAEWRDKNGSAAKMTRQAGTPTVVASGIGGIPTVSFDTSSWMNDDVNHAAPVTIFYVSRQTGGFNERVLGGGNNWLLGYWQGYKDSALFGEEVNMPGNGASDTNAHLYAATIGGSGQNSTVWAEGAQIASNQGGTEGPDNLQLNGYGGGNELSDCDISEVLVYNRILNAIELEAVGGYLTVKYGLTTSYPTTQIIEFGPGAVINQNTTNIAWTVPYGTAVTNLAPSFILSAGAACYSNSSCAAEVQIYSGTPFDFTSPVHYFVVSSDSLITNDYTVTVTIAPLLPGGVTDLVLWLDASQLGLSDGATVNTWTDMSGLNNNATNTAGTPIYKTGILNGQPVVRFDDNSALQTADLSAQFPTAATGFIVTTIDNDDIYTLVKATPYGDEWWRYDNGLSYPAFFRANRLEEYCAMPNTGSNLFAITSSATDWEMSINGISQGVQGGDYGAAGEIIIGNGSSGGGLNGDIAEVLIYSRVLSSNELEAVGGYLTEKYGLTTTYPPTTPQAGIATFGLPGMPATINQTDKTISWTVTYVSDPASLAAEFSISSGAKIYDGDPGSGGTEIASGTVRDFTNPVDYWVKSSDDLITNKYTVTVIHTPISSAKDITSFSYLGIVGTIDGTNITQNVPFGTALATLAPDYTVSQYFGGSATGSPVSGTAPSPSFAVQNPASYTVTAQDGSTQAYSVLINELPDMPTLVNVNYYAGDIPGNAAMNGIYSFDPTASGSASRAAPSTYSGNTWNDYNSPTASGSNLLDSKGNSTGIGFTTTLLSGPWNDWNGLNNNRMLVSAVIAGNYTTFRPIFTLSGLDIGHAYDLYIASRVNDDNHPTDFLIGGTTKHLENAGATDWAEGDSYVCFTNVIPQPDGTLVVNAKGTGAYSVSVNGFQLQDKGVRGQNSEALIYSFNSLAGAGPVTMAGTDISMVMAAGSSVSALVPTFTMSPAAVCTLATVVGTPIVSGITPVDFTDPVHFIVKSEDGSTTTDYTVTVNLVAPSGKVYLNIDNTVQTGLEGPAGGLGETWNQRSSSSASDLLDSVGLPSTVGFTCSGTGGWGLGDTAEADPTLWMLKQGFANFDANPPNTQQLVITGLNPAKTYDLSIASAILITSDQCSRGEWSTPNTTSTVGSQAVDNTLDENGSTWVRGNNYVLFEDVKPDGSGNITVDGYAITDITEPRTYDIRLALNGFQLVELPPRGTIILLH